MAEIAGKIWGLTTEFFRCQTVSAHYLQIKKGGFSSLHKHDIKANVFYVVKGRLSITQEMGLGVSDVTVLTAGQSTVIPPGIFHQFRADLDTECIEVYQASLTDPDIDRKTVGGMT